MGSFKPGSWGDAVWAGLPHLLIAMLAGMSAILWRTSFSSIAWIVPTLALLAGLLATIYFSWRRKGPAWSASWYGYVALIVLVLATEGSQGWQPPINQILNAVGGLVLLIVSIAALRYWLTRRNPVEALLAALPLIILYWLVITEFIANDVRTGLIFGLFLLSGLAALAITRVKDPGTAIWVILGASMLGGLPIAYAREYGPHTAQGALFSSPSLSSLVELFSVQWLASSALAIAPVLGWGVWWLGKSYGRAGKTAAILTILGALASLWGQFRYFQWYSHIDFFDAFGLVFFHQPGRVSSLFMICAGTIAALTGGVSLAFLTWIDSKRLAAAVMLVPFALPILAMLPVYFGFHIKPAGLPFEFGYLNETLRNLIFLAGAASIALSAWAAARLHSGPITVEVP
jgi:hypothetical protein